MSTFTITHPKYHVSILQIPVPTALEASLILENLAEFKEVLEKAFADDYTGQCGNCGTWQTRWGGCDSGSGMGYSCSSKKLKPRHVDWMTKASYCKMDCIGIGSWKVNFQNQFETDIKEIAMAWLGQFGQFTKWLQSLKVPIRETFTVDLTALPEDLREIILVAADKYGWRT